MKRLKKTKSTSNFIKLLAVSIGHFANDFYMNLVPPILFLFADTLSLNLTQQGLIAFAITSSGSFTQPFIGYLVDKRGKPWLLILAVSWIAFWMSISGLVDSYYILLIVLILGSSASALYHPLGSAVAISLAKKTKGTSLSVFMTIGGFAVSISPIVALPIVQKYGLSKLAYLMIPGFMISGLMYIAQLHKAELAAPSVRGSKHHAPLDFYAIKWLAALIFIATVKVTVQSSFVTFGIQLLKLKNISITTAGFILSIYLFINSAGTMIGGYLSDVFGNKKIFILSILFVTVCNIVIVWGNTIPVLIAFTLIGLGLSASNTPNVVLAQDLMPQNMNTATGLIMGFARSVGGLGILLYGKLADVYGLIPATALLLIPLIISGILTMLLPKTSKSIDKLDKLAV